MHYFVFTIAFSKINGNLLNSDAYLFFHFFSLLKILYSYTFQLLILNLLSQNNILKLFSQKNLHSLNLRIY
jgi:hypothetical protein